jgi:hypothetical protein
MQNIGVTQSQKLYKIAKKYLFLNIWYGIMLNEIRLGGVRQAYIVS